MAQLDKFLKACAENNCSDLHVAAAIPIMTRRLGEMMAVSNQAISAGQSESLIFELLNEEDRRRLKTELELDTVYVIDGSVRFRVNACREQHGFAAVFRNIPSGIKSFDDLGLPDVVNKFVLATQGMIVVTGPSRSGKTATLASMVDFINTNRNEHIITIEDPIEYLHVNKKSVVSQRGVGPHTQSFNNALRAALREDPDIIMVGEIRDLETMSLALTAAETGHLVLTTLHTAGAAATINRIINVFPPSEQSQAQNTLSECLIGVVSQQLMKNTAGTDMIAAFEILVNTFAVANVIREGDTFKLESMMQVGKKDGMKLMGETLKEMLTANQITKETLEDI